MKNSYISIFIFGLQFFASSSGSGNYVSGSSSSWESMSSNEVNQPSLALKESYISEADQPISPSKSSSSNSIDEPKMEIPLEEDSITRLRNEFKDLSAIIIFMEAQAKELKSKIEESEQNNKSKKDEITRDIKLIDERTDQLNRDLEAIKKLIVLKGEKFIDGKKPLTDKEVNNIRKKIPESKHLTNAELKEKAKQRITIIESELEDKKTTRTEKVNQLNSLDLELRGLQAELENKNQEIRDANDELKRLNKELTKPDDSVRENKINPVEPAKAEKNLKDDLVVDIKEAILLMEGYFKGGKYAKLKRLDNEIKHIMPKIDPISVPDKGLPAKTTRKLAIGSIHILLKIHRKVQDMKENVLELTKGPAESRVIKLIYLIENLIKNHNYFDKRYAEIAQKLLTQFYKENDYISKNTSLSLIDELFEPEETTAEHLLGIVEIFREMLKNDHQSLLQLELIFREMLELLRSIDRVYGKAA